MIAGGTSRRGGMTLIELLVALAVMAMMILAFAVILSQSQKVTSGAELLMRRNAAASAIIRTLRDDVASISRDGLLGIHRVVIGTDLDGDDMFCDHLVFVSTGTYRSRTVEPDGTPIYANAAQIDYGVTNYESQETGGVLWRRAKLLNPEAGKADDVLKFPLMDYRTYDTDRCGYQAENLANDPPIWNTLVPPRGLDDLSSLWPYLASPVIEFKVEWWDEAASPPAWNDADDKADTGVPEDDTVAWCFMDFRATEAEHKWPKALRIRFTIGYQNDPADAPQDYEVICPIRPR